MQCWNIEYKLIWCKSFQETHFLEEKKQRNSKTLSKVNTEPTIHSFKFKYLLGKLLSKFLCYQQMSTGNNAFTRCWFICLKQTHTEISFNHRVNEWILNVILCLALFNIQQWLLNLAFGLIIQDNENWMNVLYLQPQYKVKWEKGENVFIFFFIPMSDRKV